jgi:hypothetical protein
MNALLGWSNLVTAHSAKLLKVLDLERALFEALPD